MKSVDNDMSAGHGTGKIIWVVDCLNENGSLIHFVDLPWNCVHSLIILYFLIIVPLNYAFWLSF